MFVKPGFWQGIRFLFCFITLFRGTGANLILQPAARFQTLEAATPPGRGRDGLWLNPLSLFVALG